jgi:hypothetical protein
MPHRTWCVHASLEPAPEPLTHFRRPIGTSTAPDLITVEPRPGGHFETLMVFDATGDGIPLNGVFIEFDPLRSYSFTEAGAEAGVVRKITFNDLGDGRTGTVTL